MIRRALPWLARLGVAGLFLPLVTAPQPLVQVAQAASAITFETPSVVDPIRANGEPDIGIDPQGRVFVSGPTGTGTQRSTWYGSVDGGHSYRTITPNLPPSAVAGLADPPGGGDTDINFDRSGKQYFADLYALTCLRTAVTADGGASVADQIYPAGCSGVPGADRQWLAVYDPAPGTSNRSAYTGPRPLIYMAYNNLVNGTQWTKSTDGLTYVGAPLDPPSYAPFGADGYPAIDQVTGKLFQASGSGSSLLLNIGTPSATGDLTFLDAPTAAAPNGDTSKLIHIADNLKGSPDTLFSVLSMDQARNLYVAFAVSSSTPSDRQVFVSASSPDTGWQRWTTPVQVSQSPSNVNVFPWIKAGGAGRAAAVWYGTDTIADPSSHSNQAWYPWLAQTVFPVDANGHLTYAAPASTMARVAPHPNHYDDICLSGTGCIASQGNRNLADFFAVTIDQTGAAEVVYADTSNMLAQPGFTPTGNQTVDHAGAPVVMVARQNGGPGLFGQQVSGPSSAPSGRLTDPAGDALYPVIGGQNQPGFDLLDRTMSLSGGTLTIQLKIADLAHPGTAITAVPGAANVQYVTRWQVGNTIYYAGMENTAANQPSFYAGAAKSIDLCSVSACDPHVIQYPEPGFGGHAEQGRVDCPSSPSASNPCTMTITVNAGDIGSPTSSSLLEEVGTYAFAATLPSGALNNANAAADNVPLEVDAMCCNNFNAAASASIGCERAEGSGNFKQADGSDATFEFDADPCDGDGKTPHVTFTNSNGRTFTSATVASVFYNVSQNSLVVSGEGVDSGQTVTYAATFAQSAGSPGFAQLVVSDGLTMSGNLVSGVLELH